MELVLDRKWKKSTYSIGYLYIDGKYFCDTVEDRDRGLKQSMSVEDIKKIKVPKQTAIPLGKYTVRMDIISPKFSQKTWYKQNCRNGRLPRLMNVPGYQGILIHAGSTANSSAGCIIVGKNTIKGAVTSSQETFLKLYNILYDAYKRGEKITITIK